jgi:hypothetical protein
MSIQVPELADGSDAASGGFPCPGGIITRHGFRRHDVAAACVAATPMTGEAGMDELEAKGQARQLHSWMLSPEEQGSLKLVLQYDSGSDATGEGQVQLLLAPQAALYLADELNRQARRTLETLEPR